MVIVSMLGYQYELQVGLGLMFLSMKRDPRRYAFITWTRRQGVIVVLVLLLLLASVVDNDAAVVVTEAEWRLRRIGGLAGNVT